MIRFPRRAALPLALLVMTACGGAAAAPAHHTAAARQTPAVHSVAAPTGTATPPSEVAREAANPDPNFDYGFVVQITPQGFRPAWLVAACCQPITWKNMSGTTASVVFDVQNVSSGPIPPGGTWVFTPPNAESLLYHAGNDASTTGNVQVNQTVEG